MTKTPHRLSSGGDRHASSALYIGAIVRMCHHQPTGNHVERRTNEGLSKRETIPCLRRYIAREIYANLPRPEPPSKPHAAESPHDVDNKGASNASTAPGPTKGPTNGSTAPTPNAATNSPSGCTPTITTAATPHSADNHQPPAYLTPQISTQRAGPDITGIHYRSGYNHGESLALWDCDADVEVVRDDDEHPQDMALGDREMLLRLQVQLQRRKIIVTTVPSRDCKQCQNDALAP